MSKEISPIDEVLSDAVQLIGSTIPYESLYLYGSRAQKTSTAKSDYDLVLVLKTELFLVHYVRLFRLERLLKRHFKTRVDLHIAAAAFLGRSGAGLPLRVLRRNGILISGKAGLPESYSVIERSSYSLTIAHACLEILLNSRLTSEGLFVEKKYLEKTGRILTDYSELLSSYGNVAGLANELEGFRREEKVDAQQLYSSVAPYLATNLEGLRFSHFNLPLYLFLAWIKRRKGLHFGVFFRRRHITERLLQAQVLLFEAASHHPPDAVLLRRIRDLLDDHVSSVDLKDACRAWNQLRNVVGSYWFPAVEAVRFTRDAWFY